MALADIAYRRIICGGCKTAYCSKCHQRMIRVNENPRVFACVRDGITTMLPAPWTTESCHCRVIYDYIVGSAEIVFHELAELALLDME